MTLSHEASGDQQRRYNDFMKLLLTNDDGVAAPGLQALYQAAAQLGDAVIVAPSACLSGCSHRVTTDKMLEIESQETDRFAVTGTPADCVRVALHGLVPHVGWVLSGINAGGNLGADVWHSGTVAAAREAALHGLPGIALSHYRKKDMQFDWDWAAECVLPLLRELMGRPWQSGTFWNINLPNLLPGSADPEVVFCPLDPGPLPLSYRDVEGRLHYNGDYHNRRRLTGSDVDVCFSGRIAVTLLSLA
jgi:5'-nucleotidase